MLRLRMISSADLRELLHWLQSLSTPLARRGILIFIQVDDPANPSYVDLRLDGCERLTAITLVAQKLEHFALGRWLYCYMRRQSQRNFDYLSWDELDYIAASAFKRSVSARASFGLAEGSTELANEFAELLRSCGEVDLDGVLRFRHAAWIRHAWVLIRDQVENYLIDREYEQFIGALRYYLEITPMTPGCVHVVCASDYLQSFDQSRVPLDTSMLEEIAREADDEMHPQDILMSALITRAPERVIIHTRDVEDDFVATLTRVFRDRVSICSDPDCEYFSRNIDKGNADLYTTL